MQQVNESRLQILEKHAADGDANFVQWALDRVSPQEQLALIKAMRQDFERMHDVDPQFPTLQIVGRNSFGETKISHIYTQRDLPMAERLFDPSKWGEEKERKIIYRSPVTAFRQKY
jgi:hypothetical protein